MQFDVVAVESPLTTLCGVLPEYDHSQGLVGTVGNAF